MGLTPDWDTSMIARIDGSCSGILRSVTVNGRSFVLTKNCCMEYNPKNTTGPIDVHYWCQGETSTPFLQHMVTNNLTE